MQLKSLPNFSQMIMEPKYWYVTLAGAIVVGEVHQPVQQQRMAGCYVGIITDAMHKDALSAKLSALQYPADVTTNPDVASGSDGCTGKEFLTKLWPKGPRGLRQCRRAV